MLDSDKELGEFGGLMKSAVGVVADAVGSMRGEFNREIALTLRDLFVQLKDVGFDDDQALRIVTRTNLYESARK